jgi:hypothetical protein
MNFGIEALAGCRTSKHKISPLLSHDVLPTRLSGRFVSIAGSKAQLEGCVYLEVASSHD